MALYDLARVAGLEEESYVRLRRERSAREREVLREMVEVVERGVWLGVGIRTRADGRDGDGKEQAGRGEVVMVVRFVVSEQSEAEVHGWYEEEHTADLAKIEGWCATRRYRRARDGGRVELLAVHEFDGVNGLDGPEHQRARARPWRERIVGLVESRDSQRFELWREFRAEDYRPP